MIKEDIITLVQTLTGIELAGMKRSKPETALFARYVAIVIMIEEGYSKPEVAACFEVDRTSVYYALKSVDDLLVYNKKFKKMYLACIKRIAEMEEAA
jgi:hypothetical protein